MFNSWFFKIFYQNTSKFGFWAHGFWVLEDGWVLTIKSKHLKDFFEISLFPKILSIKLFGNSWGNLYIHFLVIIIWFRYTYGEKKFLLKSEEI